MTDRFFWLFSALAGFVLLVSAVSTGLLAAGFWLTATNQWSLAAGFLLSLCLAPFALLIYGLFWYLRRELRRASPVERWTVQEPRRPARAERHELRAA